MSDPDVQRLQRSAALVRAARNIRWPGETVDTLMLDAIAQLHPHNLTDPNLRAVFQATLDRCDEPHADLEKIRITVENQIDAEPCPPFEFHYTNSLVYGNNVHRGEPARLKGCGCEGGCKPDSKTCACLRTQNMYWKIFGFAAGFNVDAEGCVVDPGFPIFECNEACGCDETCMNRVVQRGRQYSVVIRKTLRKGWARSYLGIYAGELITLNESDHRGDIYDIFGRTYQFTVDFWYLQQGYRRIIRRIREGGAPGAFDADETIFPTFCVDAFHVGNFTRFLNHSCDPNCVVVAVHINEPHIYKPFMCLFTNKALKAGEEFTFNYGGAQGGDDQPRQKKKGRGKKNGGLKDKACHCGASKCTGRFF
ncbi:SET domain-containing protein [Auriculariales sp. MPI-PUGE-AT-0066]|nr:SET domain-containing protein [Auriculariales sp. MPI-PUGE-AT-0066]